MASSSTHPPFLLHQPKHQRPDQFEQHNAHPHQARIPLIPDLRFEHSYLRSIQRYVTIRRPLGRPRDDPLQLAKKEEDHFPQSSTLSHVSAEVINIRWGNVAWITIRDQIISPFLTGALWAIASYFFMPFSTRLGNKASKFTRSHLSSSKEGSGVGWLRGWASRLNVGMSSASGTRA